MVRGEVEVILYDEKGKVVNRQKAHNLVTNATKEIRNMIAGKGASMSEMMPIAEKALGGLMLFTGSITEDADEFNMPANGFIACAGRYVDNSNKFRGSYNEYESERLSTGFKSVWDFSTSQANGTINSLALTSLQCGENPFCENFTSLLSITSQNILKPVVDGNPELNHNGIFPLKYDRETQNFYFLRLVRWTPPDRSQQPNVPASWIYRVCYTRIPFFGYKVDDYVSEMGYYEDTSTEITFPAQLSNYGSIDLWDEDGYAYFKYSTSSSETLISGNVLGRVNLSDFSKEDDIVIDTSTYEDRFCVTNGYLFYFKTYQSQGKVTRRKISDGTSSDYNVGVDFNGYHRIFGAPNGLAYIERFSQNSDTYCLYPDGSTVRSIYTKIGDDIGTVMIDKSLFIRRTAGAINDLSFGVNNNYLGTIFNLQEGVQKTPATTMKIIYTLTDVSS